MKKTAIAIAVTTALFASTSSLACQGGSCAGGVSVPVVGSIAQSVTVTGGGFAGVHQAGNGTSIAEFSTTAGGNVSGSTSLDINRAGRRDGPGFGVDTSASIQGAAFSQTDGSVVGNAWGSQASNSVVDGSASVGGSYNATNDRGVRDVNAGSNVLGGASAGSKVTLNPGDGSAFSRQDADFSADHYAYAQGRRGSGDEYCEDPAFVELSLDSYGWTDSAAWGTLSGTGAEGSSAAFAAEGGYAIGEVSRVTEYVDLRLSGDLGNNALFTGVEVQSYTAVRNGPGDTSRDADSYSDVHMLGARAEGYSGPCCEPDVTVEIDDYKIVEGNVYGAGHPDNNFAGGSVRIEFSGSANGTVVGDEEPGDD